MAKNTETLDLSPTDALRKGWLAYLGLYGAAYERVKPITAKAGEAFEGLIAKGETVETNAQEIADDVRERATGFYSGRFAKVRGMLPSVMSKNSRVEDLEAEVAALNKKVAALTKKTTAKARAKAA